MPWTGFDLDGTLAVDLPGRKDDTEIGSPIRPMVQLAKRHIRHGMDVRLFTARAYPHNRTKEEHEEVLRAMRDWCKLHLGQEIPIQCHKDHDIGYIFDDKTYRVMKDAGVLLGYAGSFIIPEDGIMKPNLI